MYTNYKTINGLVQGESSISLKKEKVSDSYVDFTLVASSDKWNNIDVAFEYRLNECDTWRTDAYISKSTSEYVIQNKMFGLISNRMGYSNTFRWEYQKNDIIYGMSVKTRLRLLPRIRTYSQYSNNTIISESYGQAFSSINSVGNKKCIGTDLYGRYLSVDNNSFYIYDNINDDSPLYYVSGLINPCYAKQISNGRYIVSNNGGNSIIEYDNSLSTITKTCSVSSPIYFDFMEMNETMALISEGSSTFKEITWGDTDYGTLVWESPSIFSNPLSVRYNRNNVNEFIVVEQSTDSICLINKQDNIYSFINQYKLNGCSKEEGIKSFWNPNRAYFYNNDTICVIEKDGEVINFTNDYSSSSSSSSSLD